MSWEVVRQLGRMPQLLLFVRNLSLQGRAPADVLENIEDVQELLDEVLAAIRDGEPL